MALGNGQKITEFGICGHCGNIAYITDGMRHCRECDEMTTDCRCVDSQLPA